MMVRLLYIVQDFCRGVERVSALVLFEQCVNCLRHITVTCRRCSERLCLTYHPPS
jgi:hypothetical protein